MGFSFELINSIILSIFIVCIQWRGREEERCCVTVKTVTKATEALFVIVSFMLVIHSHEMANKITYNGNMCVVYQVCCLLGWNSELATANVILIFPDDEVR